ncbi:MAG: hypothetical protein M3Y41_16460 [Pseudomonadota bacterium]|nr:hypothetical protein [Pseudomonadota bacterium]
MMYGMGFVGVIVVVLAVLGIIALTNTLCEVGRAKDKNITAHEPSDFASVTRKRATGKVGGLRRSGATALFVA